MDSRRLSPGQRRRVGLTPSMYDQSEPAAKNYVESPISPLSTTPKGSPYRRTRIVGRTEMETDMGIISNHLAARRASHDEGRA